MDMVSMRAVLLPYGADPVRYRRGARLLQVAVLPDDLDSPLVWITPRLIQAMKSLLIVPTSRRRTVRLGMQPETLSVSAQRTQSVLTGVTTQSVGTIDMWEMPQARRRPHGWGR